MTYAYFPNVDRYLGHSIYRPYKWFTEEQTNLIHASTQEHSTFYLIQSSKNREIQNNLQKIF